jgi:CBS domain-containing protein
MQCREIMSHDVQWIRPGETVAGAAKMMAFYNVGLLPICSADGKPLGVITDRDIALRVIGKDRLAAQTVVEDVMTTPVQSVTSDCALDRVGELMTKAGVSRLLVLDKAGHLEGLVSVADLMVRAPGHTASEAARGVYARETSVHLASGHPRPASKPDPAFFHGVREVPRDYASTAENPARVEADAVVHGGTNDLKEFPA